MSDSNIKIPIYHVTTDEDGRRSQKLVGQLVVNGAQIHIAEPSALEQLFKAGKPSQIQIKIGSIAPWCRAARGRA